jgi:signal transduction histidine kinase
MAAMGALAAGVAHEINSPLAGALYVLEVLRRDASTEQGRKYGDLMQEALERIRDLVQRLLQLSPGKAESSTAKVGPLLDDLRAFLASRLRKHELIVELSSAEFEVAAARGDLFPLMLNLLQNALDALDGMGDESGGVITVHGNQLKNGGTQLVIADNGPGAPAHILPHLFEPFFTSKDVGKGTGLGLAIAHASMRRLGGSIRASNGEDGGFCVVLEFPETPAEEGEQEASSSVQEANGNDGGQPQNIKDSQA